MLKDDEEPEMVAVEPDIQLMKEEGDWEEDGEVGGWMNGMAGMYISIFTPPPHKYTIALF